MRPLLATTLTLIGLLAPKVSGPTEAGTPTTPGPAADLTTTPLASPAVASQSFAIVVHEDNPVQDITSNEMFSLFKLEQQEWDTPDDLDATLLLRKTKSDEMRALLEVVYKMSDRELRQYWTGKINRGEITTKPRTIGSDRKLATEIAKRRGAFSVMRSDAVPEGLRAVKVDGRAVGDQGYPLVTETD